MLFSSTVNAAPVANGAVRVYQEAWTYGTLVDEWRTSANIYTGQNEIITRTKNTGLELWADKWFNIFWACTFVKDDGSPLFLTGHKYTFTASNLYSQFGYNKTNGSRYELFQLNYYANELMTTYVKYTDGSTGYLNGTFSVDSYSNGATFKVSFEPVKDVRSICFEVMSHDTATFADFYPSSVDFTFGSNRYPLSVDIASTVVDEETTGLLETIINKIKSIITNIVDGFSGIGTAISNIFGKITEGFADLAKRLGSVVDNIKDGFKDTLAKLKDIFDTLASLPANIWSYIKKGLISLFVPDKMFLEQEYDNWNGLLESKFGILYQGVSYIREFFDRIDLLGTGDSYINFPEVTIPLPDNNEFTFGGFDVNLIPSKFYPISQSCKTIVGIICTFAFLNGLRKRYESIIGG